MKNPLFTFSQKYSYVYLGLMALTPIASCTNVEDNILLTQSPSSLKIQADDYSKILDIALKKQSGTSSGPSISGSSWLTDCSSGDGGRLIDAITIYDTWFKPARIALRLKANDLTTYPKITDAKKAEMKKAFEKSTYTPETQGKIVDKIIERYNAKFTSLSGNISIPKSKDDNAVLDFLEIRKQCMEFLQTIVNDAKISKSAPPYQNNGYKDYILKDINNIKAGMFLYKKSTMHIAIITSVQKDYKGTLYVTIVEANWGKGWSNPDGQIAWERTIGVRTSNYRVLDSKKKEVSKGDFDLAEYDIVKVDK